MFLRTIISRLLLFVALLLLLLLVIRQVVNRSITCVPECVGENLLGHDLKGLDLRKVNFVEAQLQGSDLSFSDLREADLSGANLTGARLRNANLANAKFIGANLTGADLINATLTGTDLSGANLTEADLTTNDLRETIVSGARFPKAVLAKALLQNANLGGLSLAQANLTGADLSDVNLAGSHLSGADLSGATLERVDLTGAWLNTANLIGASLKQADLSGSSMIAAQLTSANLQGARLEGAILIGANLDGANLRSADLRLVQTQPTQLDLYYIENDSVLQALNELQRSALVTDTNLKGVESDTQTLWPQHLRPTQALQAAELAPENAPAFTVENAAPQHFNVLFFIKSLNNIDLQQGRFDADLYLDLHWFDPLVGEQDVAMLDSDSIWQPELVLANSSNAEFVFASLNASMTPRYNLLLSHRVRGTFASSFDLHKFPFDRQTMRLNMELGNANSDRALLDFFELDQEVIPTQKTPYRQKVPSGRYVAHDALSEEWQIEETTIVQQLRTRINGNDTWSQMGIELHLRRQSLGYVWKLFMPMIVILILVWGVLLVVDSQDFAFHLWLLFLLFVAQAAFHATVWGDVPHPPYLTLFDRYMLTGYLAILTVILLVCINVLLQRLHYRRIAYWFERVLEVGYPTVGVVVNLWYYWQATS